MTIYQYQRHIAHTRIRRWKNQLNLDKHALVFERIYSSVDGFKLSRHARQKQDALEYVYGEIDFISFIALLSLAKPSPQTIFYDLGSGVGKAVIASAMVFNLKKCCGIELFYEMHSAAVSQKQKLAALSSYAEKSNAMYFIHGDILTTDFHDATLIFINATAFFGDHWRHINDQLTKTIHCQTVITTSKKLISNAFIVVNATKVRMSWGIVNAYVHHRANKKLNELHRIH